MTAFQKQVKRVLTSQTSVNPDRVICRADGSVEVKRGYYYAPCTPQEWGERVQRVLANSGIRCSVTTFNDWRPWPKDSYLVAVVREG